MANTFVPKAGRNCEVDARIIGAQCVAMLYEIVPDGSGFRRAIRPTQNASCPREDASVEPARPTAATGPR